MDGVWMIAAAILVAALLLAFLLRRGPKDAAHATEAFGMLAGKLEALAGTQERLADGTLKRLTEQDRLLADRLDAAARFANQAALDQNDRLVKAITSQNDRLGQISDTLGKSIAAQNERLDLALATQNEKLTKTLSDSAQVTQETAGKIHERLAVIDEARKNMEALGGQVTTLAGILGNKQARGAYGEMQLRQILEDRLPPEGFSWQHTLSTGVRCDSLIHLPFPPGPVVVDSKFPLEAWQALRDAGDDVSKRTAASRQFVSDMRKHVGDIAQKYLIAGETAEGAILFVPSEAIFGEMLSGFAGIFDDAQRRRVHIASPTTLWAILSAMRALMQDVRMRAQAGRIKEEVGKLVLDVGRLDDRVANLKKHFGQAQNDIRDIEISTGKIMTAGSRIETVQIAEELPVAAIAPPPTVT